MPRLLIIACSEKKVRARQLVPAIDRYDGPAFGVLRKYLRETEADAPTVFILSAMHGLIAAGQEIAFYNRRLTRDFARELRPAVLEAASAALQSGDWSEVGVCAGKGYRLALEGLSDLVPEGVPLTWVEGGQGVRLTNLKKWLRESESPQP